MDKRFYIARRASGFTMHKYVMAREGAEYVESVRAFDVSRLKLSAARWCFMQ